MLGMKPQFSLRRLFIATTLIAIGCVEAAYFIAHFRDFPPMTTLQLVTWLTYGPLIGAGLSLPFNHPEVGAILGFLGSICLMFYLGCVTGGMSV